MISSSKLSHSTATEDHLIPRCSSTCSMRATVRSTIGIESSPSLPRQVTPNLSPSPKPSSTISLFRSGIRCSPFRSDDTSDVRRIRVRPTHGGLLPMHSVRGQQLCSVCCACSRSWVAISERSSPRPSPTPLTTSTQPPPIRAGCSPAYASACCSHWQSLPSPIDGVAAPFSGSL